MKKIKLGITGCMGRMGQQLIKSLKKNNNFKLVTLTENKVLNKKFNNIKPELNTENAFRDTDIIIDFTINTDETNLEDTQRNMGTITSNMDMLSVNLNGEQTTPTIITEARVLTSEDLRAEAGGGSTGGNEETPNLCAAVTCPAATSDCKVAGECMVANGSCSTERNKADGASCNLSGVAGSGVCNAGVCTPTGTDIQTPGTELTCASHTCGINKFPIQNPSSVTCTGGICTDAECCVESYVCREQDDCSVSASTCSTSLEGKLQCLRTVVDGKRVNVDGIVEICDGETLSAEELAACIYPADIELNNDGSRVEFAYTEGDGRGVKVMDGLSAPIHVKVKATGASDGMRIEIVSYEYDEDGNIESGPYTFLTPKQYIMDLDDYLTRVAPRIRAGGENRGNGGVFYKYKDNILDEEYKDFSDRIFRYYVRQVCLKGSSTCDQDCYGRWSSCTEDCEEGDEREFIEEVPQNGLGEQCPDNDKAPDCEENEDECKAPKDGNLIMYIIIGIVIFIFILGIMFLIASPPPMRMPMRPPMMRPLPPPPMPTPTPVPSGQPLIITR